MNIWQNRNWKPMLLKEVDKPFDSKDYLFEIKFDGIRAICFTDGKNISFMSRNNNDLTNLFPELTKIKNNVYKKVIFDGEIILFENNKPSFSKIQERMRLKDKTKINRLIEENPAVFIAFDILYENKDLTNMALTERKKILNTYKDTDEFIKSITINKTGIKLFKEIKKQNLEGIVAKLKTGTYHINKRTDDFIKIKNIQREKFYICGYKNNSQKLSLFLGGITNKKRKFVGKCSILKNSNEAKIITNNKKVDSYLDNLKEEINYINPIPCYIEFTEYTKDKHLRHPVFKGLIRKDNHE